MKWINSSTLRNITSIVASILSFVTVVLIFCQGNTLNNQIKVMKVQNIIQERALIQQYRPLGKVERPIENGNNIIRYNVVVDTLTTGFKWITLTEKFVNKGVGLLLSVGTITCVSQNKINFRDMLIKGSFDTTVSVITINDEHFQIFLLKGNNKYHNELNSNSRLYTYMKFDKRYDNARMLPIIPNTDIGIPLEWIFDNYREHYVYNLFLYKDIDGNLYDTLSLDYIRNDNIAVIDSIVTLNHNEYFGSYSSQDQEMLFKQVKMFNASMGTAISKKIEYYFPIENNTNTNKNFIVIPNIMGNVLESNIYYSK